jgi:hypothetical protein
MVVMGLPAIGNLNHALHRWCLKNCNKMDKNRKYQIKILSVLFLVVIGLANLGLSEEMVFFKPQRSDASITLQGMKGLVRVTSEFTERVAGNYGIPIIIDDQCITGIEPTTENVIFCVADLSRIMSGWECFVAFYFYTTLIICIVTGSKLLLCSVKMTRFFKGYYLIIVPCLVLSFLYFFSYDIATLPWFEIGNTQNGGSNSISFIDMHNEGFAVYKMKDDYTNSLSLMISVEIQFNIEEAKILRVRIPQSPGKMFLYLDGHWVNDAISDIFVDRSKRDFFIEIGKQSEPIPEVDCAMPFSEIYNPLTYYEVPANKINSEIIFEMTTSLILREAFKQFASDTGCQQYYSMLYCYTIIAWVIISSMVCLLFSKIFFPINSKLMVLIGFGNILTPYGMYLLVKYVIFRDDTLGLKVLSPNYLKFLFFATLGICMLWIIFRFIFG